uniref:Uncharacterized protein n=1 Tax=Compsopogon caeruleus TaxID=31354 RepID=A0A6T6CWT5_9RHOD|mmetsp:Transcript_4691/g.9466  ORF Transcript_4691/g.9466 Transcript_4691/m.9466 type:complete len:142 (+) Transcript_4691:2343-2768(+)
MNCSRTRNDRNSKGIGEKDEIGPGVLREEIPRHLIEKKSALRARFARRVKERVGYEELHTTGERKVVKRGLEEVTEEEGKVPKLQKGELRWERVPVKREPAFFSDEEWKIQLEDPERIHGRLLIRTKDGQVFLVLFGTEEG